MFQFLDSLIEAESNDTQDDERCDQIVEFENLACVDDEVAEALPCGEKFSNDDADQAETDVDLQNADDGGQAGGDYHMLQYLQAAAAQGVDQLDLFLIGVPEGGIHADNAAEDGNGHSGDDDGPGVGAQPDDEEGSQGGFGQAVQDDKPGFQDLGKGHGEPEDGGSQKTDQHHQCKAQQRFVQSDAGMAENGVIPAHVCHGLQDPAGAAEDKGIDPVQVCAHFPQDEEEEKGEEPAEGDQMVMPPVISDIFLLTGRHVFIVHVHSAPSRFH